MEKKLETVLGYVGLDGDMAKIAAVVVVVVGGAVIAFLKKRKQSKE